MDKMLSVFKFTCLSLKGMLCSISTATCKFTRKKEGLTVIKLWTVSERSRGFCCVFKKKKKLLFFFNFRLISKLIAMEGSVVLRYVHFTLSLWDSTETAFKLYLYKTQDTLFFSGISQYTGIAVSQEHHALRI